MSEGMPVNAQISVPSLRKRELRGDLLLFNDRRLARLLLFRRRQ